tara:strand:+ start:3886 stop:4140 length:255 start_codon:yes stop_codon:yes gene_type:complete
MTLDYIAQGGHLVGGCLAVQLQAGGVCGQLASAEGKADGALVVVKLGIHLVAEVAAEFFQVEAGVPGAGGAVLMLHGGNLPIDS